MSLPTLGITLNLYDGTGAPLTTGSAVFTPVGPVTVNSGLQEITPAPVTEPMTGGLPTAAIIPTDIAGSSPSGWAWQVAFPGVPGDLDAFTFKCPAGPVAFTAAIGTPGVVTWTPTSALTSLPPGTGVQFASGAPAGTANATTYYVTSSTSSTCRISATLGGSPLAFTGTGSGTLTVVSYLLSGLAPVGSPMNLSPFMFAPSGTPAAGQVPVATGTGSASAWGTVSGGSGAVASVFTRTGSVTAQSGDYSVGQVTGAAPLASPAFTGTPTAPTAAALANSTQAATTAYADSAVGVEKTRALAAENLKAPLASPAFTGTPTAPTASPGDNTTKIATTAFVTATAGGVAYVNMVTQAGADPTGAADIAGAVTAALAILGSGNPGVLYFPSGTYLLNTSTAVTLAAAGLRIEGDGPAATVFKIGSSFTGTAVFNVTAGYCQIAGLSVIGASTTVTSNPACDAIMLQGGRYCRVENVFFQYVNGWCVESVATSSNAGYATMLTRLSGLNCAGGVHVKSNTSVTWAAQHFLSDLNFQQIGAATGANANLDVFRFEDCWDILGTNFNAAISDVSTGSTVNIVGNCASLYFSNMDLGTFPNSASGTNTTIRIQDGTNGSPSDVRFLQGETQQGQYGLYMTGGAKHVWFTACRFFNSYAHGAVIASTGSEVHFNACSWSLNGQGGTANSGTYYDLEWTGAATGAVSGSAFSSAVVAVGANGVQAPMDFAGAGAVSVRDCTASGTGVTSTNVFATTPKYVFRTIPWNPHGTVAITVPGSGTAAAGRSFDMYFYVTAGASTCTCAVTSAGGSTSIVIPSGGFGVVFVPAGYQLTPTYTSAPTWTVFGN